MWSIWKDTLYPGTVHVPRGAGQPPRVYEFTDKEIAAAAKSLNAKVKAGYKIPVCWEHDEAANPLPLSDAAKRSKSTFSWAEEYRVDPDGVLQVRIDGTDPDDEKQLPKTRFVSPMLDWDWVDSQGNLWPGMTIKHIAVTPRPRQQMQKPFGKNTFDPAGTSAKKSPGAIALSMDHYYTGAKRRKGVAMADEIDDTEGAEADAGAEGAEAQPAGDAGAFSEIMEMLAADNTHMPEDTTPENFLDRLRAALHQKIKGGGDLVPGEGTDPNDPNAMPPGVSVGQTPPVGMSLAEKQSVARAQTIERKNLHSTVQTLLAKGKITAEIAGKLKKEVEEIGLSFAADGSLRQNAVTIKLNAYDDLPAAAAHAKGIKRQVALSQVDAIDSPYAGKKAETPKAVNATIDTILKM